MYVISFAHAFEKTGQIIYFDGVNKNKSTY
jgi:hypothetical protein